VHTLRHWHEVGLLTPAEVDPVSGYRRYHADQLGHTRLIHSLRQADVSVSLVRQILQAAHRDELKKALQILVQQSRKRAQRQSILNQAFTVLLEYLDQWPSALPSRWIADLPPLPIGRVRVAFVGIPGGIGRTPSALSTAAMLSALGRDVVVIEVSPYGYGALKWARVARHLGDPLPFPVLSMRDFGTVSAQQDVVFDSSSRHEDLLAAATLADRVVLCARAGDRLDFTLRHERPLLTAAGVDVHGPNFGIMVTGMPDEEPERSSEDDLQWGAAPLSGTPSATRAVGASRGTITLTGTYNRERAQLAFFSGGSHRAVDTPAAVHSGPPQTYGLREWRPVKPIQPHERSALVHLLEIHTRTRRLLRPDEEVYRSVTAELACGGVRDRQLAVHLRTATTALRASLNADVTARIAGVDAPAPVDTPGSPSHSETPEVEDQEPGTAAAELRAWLSVAYPHASTEAYTLITDAAAEVRGAREHPAPRGVVRRLARAWWALVHARRVGLGPAATGEQAGRALALMTAPSELTRALPAAARALMAHRQATLWQAGGGPARERDVSDLLRAHPVHATAMEALLRRHEVFGQPTGPLMLPLREALLGVVRGAPGDVIYLNVLLSTLGSQQRQQVAQAAQRALNRGEIESHSGWGADALRYTPALR